jgi:hypothetical protein
MSISELESTVVLEEEKARFVAKVSKIVEVWVLVGFESALATHIEDWFNVSTRP